MCQHCIYLKESWVALLIVSFNFFFDLRDLAEPMKLRIAQINRIM